MKTSFRHYVISSLGGRLLHEPGGIMLFTSRQDCSRRNVVIRCTCCSCCFPHLAGCIETTQTTLSLHFPDEPTNWRVIMKDFGTLSRLIHWRKRAAGIERRRNDEMTKWRFRFLITETRRKKGRKAHIRGWCGRSKEKIRQRASKREADWRALL